MARISVARAIAESDRIIKIFLLYRSAHTPAKGDNKKVGTNPQRIPIVIMIPDWVVKVIYHMMAYWTMEEPKSDIVWLARKMLIFRFQFIYWFAVTSKYPFV